MFRENNLSYRLEVPLAEEKCCNLKNVPFEKRIQKLKKMTYLHFMAAFQNFALKIETG